MHCLINSFRLTGTGNDRVDDFKIGLANLSELPYGVGAALQVQNRRARISFRCGFQAADADEAELVLLDRLYNIPTNGTVYFQTGASAWRKVEDAQITGHPIGYAGMWLFVAYEIEGKVPVPLDGGAEPLFASDNTMIVPRTYDLVAGQDYLTVDSEGFSAAPTRATALVRLPDINSQGISVTGSAGYATTGGTFRLSGIVPSPGYKLDVIWYI